MGSFDFGIEIYAFGFIQAQIDGQIVNFLKIDKSFYSLITPFRFFQGYAGEMTKMADLFWNESGSRRPSYKNNSDL